MHPLTYRLQFASLIQHAREENKTNLEKYEMFLYEPFTEGEKSMTDHLEEVDHFLEKISEERKGKTMTENPMDPSVYEEEKGKGKMIPFKCHSCGLEWATEPADSKYRREGVDPYKASYCPHCSSEDVVLVKEEKIMREFDTGATRDSDETKLDFDGFLSPLVLKRYAEYLHEHRTQADGKLRDSDNWQKGIPLATYMKSAWRHFVDWWSVHRTLESTFIHIKKDMEDALCAVMFNTMGYLHEYLKAGEETE